MWDAEVIKSTVVAVIVAFAGSGMFYALIKLGIKKLIEKLTGAVGSLKDEQVITQSQYDKYIAEMQRRETQLVDKVGEVLDKLPDPSAISRIDTFWQGVSERIELFLDEIERDDE